MKLTCTLFLVVASVTTAAEPLPLIVSAKHWESYTPYHGALEPRIIDGVPEFRLSGGATVLSKKDLSDEGSAALEWFPELGPKDFLILYILATDMESDEPPYLLKEGISVTIGQGKSVVRVAMSDENIVITKKIAALDIDLSEQVWFPIRVEWGKGKVMVTITVEGKEIATKVEYDADKLKGRKFGFGNRLLVIRGDEKEIPVSFIRNLKFSEKAK